MSRIRENYSEEDKAIDNKLKAESRVSKLLMSAHMIGATNSYQDFEEINRQIQQMMFIYVAMQNSKDWHVWIDRWEEFDKETCILVVLISEYCEEYRWIEL